MQLKEYSVNAEIGGKSWNFSTGKLALQANSSVVVRVGDTMVMATVVMGSKPRDGIDYLPLLVDYEEKLYAAGKIKGSRWVKREGRPSDEAILSGRVIDRSFRPMFDDRIRNDIQVVVTVLSVDGVNDPAIVGLNAAAAAIEISDIPWDGPVAGVRLGKINGQFVLNPSFEQKETVSQLDLIVSGTAEHVIMVEASAREVTEEELLQAIGFAQKEISGLISTMQALRKNVGKPKAALTLFNPTPEVEAKVQSFASDLAKALYEAKNNKAEREQSLEILRENLLAKIAGEDEQRRAEVNYVFEKMMKTEIQGRILREEQRVDGRGLAEIRPVFCQVGLLPRVHGSALFQRGDTQVLTTVTLGGPGEEQLLDDIETEAERRKRYMHHYNMPGFSLGEVIPLRSPGRREIGHGALAERALLPLIPSKDGFPYTIRLVSEVLSTNGSTSMAATCGSSLALMDAGVPLKTPVAGIAMGLVLDSPTGRYKILTDIQGLEDRAGHMDFKVAGTTAGITALQLDIKVKGLTLAILRDALASAKAARQEIMQKMLETISSPRPNMSPYAPRIVSFKINPEKIREVIGPGGKTINGIIAATGVEIDIEDDGMVMVTSTNEDASKKAVERIKNLTREVKIGEEFQGKITRILDFGAFAEILPGQEGLIHISELAPYRVERVSDIVKVGDIVPVKVISIDELGRINLSKKALLPPSTQARPRPDQRPDKRRFIARKP